MKRHIWRVALAVTVMAMGLAGAGGCGGSSGTSNGGTGGGVTVGCGDFTTAASQTIGATGGTLTISDASSPLNGLKIEVPASATSEDISFTISYADVTSLSGVPTEASAASKAIKIETDGSDTWDQYKLFNQLVVVTLPYSDGGTSSEPTMFYAVDEDNQKLEAMGAFAQDTTNKTISFLTGNFSSFLAIKLQLAVSELLGTNYTADTSFRPTSDGWYITNYGSYLAQGGICYGMVSYAKWYYTTKGTGMYSKYQNSTSIWEDDDIAIQLATRAHMAEDDRWQQTFNTIISSDDTLNNQWKNPSSELIGLSLVHALKTTGAPQILGIWEQRADGKRYAGHAILTYMYSNGIFYIYDPNNPGTDTSDTDRRIGYTYGSGFALPYLSGTSASAARRNYNVLSHVSIKAAATHSAFLGLYNGAEANFQDDTIFPTVTITACKAWNTATSTTGADCTTSTNDYGETVYETSADAAKIYATITGGYSQGGPATDTAAVRQSRVINKTNMYISDRHYNVDVNNQLDAGDGNIQYQSTNGMPLPLYQGENDLVILATGQDPVSNWAGYKKAVVKSNASRADMTITLTWAQGSSDVDLHIKEPTVNSVNGRHIYWANRGQSGSPSTKPYLDFDNTTGYGPEHYYASQGMSTYDTNGTANPNGLYGTYSWRVHYYADHDSDTQNTQPISWTVTYRYLVYEDTSVTPATEFWASETRTGGLSTASTSGTSNFDSTGASWSSTYTIDYEAPNASDYLTNSPPTVMLP